MAPKLGLAVGIVLGILVAMVMAAAPKPITFVFGDSLTEVGNNNFLQYSLAKSNFPWYGVDYTGGKATGRFTNGRTIGDIISEKLGIAPPPAYLSLLPYDDAILEGVNYASGGAGILNDTGLYFVQRLSFDDQIKNFAKTKVTIKAKIGENATTALLNQAIYFIGMGSNDYVNNFLQPFLADGQQYTHDEFVELLITTLEQQLVELHQFGARKMVFHGLGPLGCIPSQRVKSKTGQCLKQVNRWVMIFNSKVEKLISKLNKRLPNAQLVFADTYPAVYDLITNPTAYGFKVSNTSCCNVDTTVGGLCLPNAKPCKNRKDYVFWDAFHPSDAANVVLANKLFQSIFAGSGPAPSPAPAPAPSPK
ncbi:unnamed protein product [Rhodiola kirilowii]